MQVKIKGEISRDVRNQLIAGDQPEHFNVFTIDDNPSAWTPVEITFKIPDKKVVFIPDPEGDYVKTVGGGIIHSPGAWSDKRFRREEQDA